jgi:predicted ribonuclease YlaK
MPPGNQLITLIPTELQSKSLDFGDIATSLQAELDRMTASPGFPIVLDANVLFQCLRLDQLDWFTEIQDEARIMLPLRVIEEIDAKKYGGNARLSQVARELLPWIDSLFPTGDTGPVPLREHATIELLLADRPRHRPSDADEEILDVAHEVLNFAGRVKLMTADTGMRARAKTEGLEVLQFPKKWRRPSNLAVTPPA